MSPNKLLVAMTEAERFLRLAQDAALRLSNDKHAGISGSKETAACRRASMDLSRALSELRKHNA